MINHIVFFHRGCRFAFAATFLRHIIVNWLRFCIARTRHCHHNGLLWDQIFTVKVHTGINDIGTTLITEVFTNLNHLIRDNGH